MFNLDIYLYIIGYASIINCKYIDKVIASLLSIINSWKFNTFNNGTHRNVAFDDQLIYIKELYAVVRVCPRLVCNHYAYGDKPVVTVTPF